MTPKQKTPMTSLILAAAIGGALVGVPITGATVLAAKHGQTVPSAATGVIPSGGLVEKRPPSTRVEASASFAPVVRSAAPAVVNVYSRKIVRQEWRSPFADDPIFGRLFGGQAGVPRERVENSLGSGVIVRGDGVVVTNNHVVDGADELRVVLSDRREFPAKLLLADPRTDLAVLKFEVPEELPTLTFADTRAAEVGDMVLAIGNPFGVGQTVTSGIISALARTDVGVTDFSFFVQTDAAINPGNSGGALVDMKGALIGVNTAIFSRSGGSQGVGFAIPSEMVRRVVEGAVSGGRVIRPWAGIRGQTVDADVARGLNLPKPGGVLIAAIEQGGPADRAGLRRGDVVIGLGGAEINDDQTLRFLAATRRPGEVVDIVWLRNGQQKQGKVKLEAPSETPVRDPKTIVGQNSFAGVSVITINPAVADERGLDPFSKGVLVVAVDRTGEAARAGFQPGDLILEVAGKPISNSEELVRALPSSGRPGQVTIERQGKRITANLLL
jgi:Do/DeqQ family serine protease